MRDETALLRCLKFVHRAGVKITPTYLTTLATCLRSKSAAQYRTKDGNPTRTWSLNFRRKYPEVNAMVTRENEAQDARGRIFRTSRVNSAQKTRESVLSSIEDLLRENSAIVTSERVYNMVAVKGRFLQRCGKFQWETAKPDAHAGDAMTITVCACATGSCLPSLITTASEDSFSALKNETGTLIRETKSGEPDRATFLEYLKNLDSCLVQERPVFVYIAGVQDLIDLEVIEFCLERGIHLLHVPFPDAAQPVDVVLHAMQTHRVERQRTSVGSQRTTVNQAIEEILSLCWKMEGEEIRRSFRDTGVFPFDKSSHHTGAVPKRAARVHKDVDPQEKAQRIQKR